MKIHDVNQFRKKILEYYRRNKRDFPWRETFEPWHILVSEVMLQQTQVQRVAVKYPEFIKSFFSPGACANAPLSAVLAKWQGLGYNRRAKYLKQTAEILVAAHGGKVPDTLAELVRLPGIGKNTAGAILAFAFNIAVPFIETNIRAVYIHLYFNDNAAVHDRDILEKIAATLDLKNPRVWYWALMDYGVYLKTQHNGLLQQSVHYKKQAVFKGSNRELRGAVIRLLLKEGPVSAAEAAGRLSKPEGLTKKTMDGLVKEKMLEKLYGRYMLREEDI
ncbi:MAG: A/G-specific adenine glycosylase [Spirochaetales bacterium]|nr:A/G-specific adenine glycosylase [Spirochaetales bacterium]